MLVKQLVMALNLPMLDLVLLAPDTANTAVNHGTILFVESTDNPIKTPAWLDATKLLSILMEIALLQELLLSFGIITNELSKKGFIFFIFLFHGF